jgi:hypothetical protein
VGLEMRTVVAHAEGTLYMMSSLNRVEGISSPITVMSLDYRTCCDWREFACAVCERLRALGRRLFLKSG